MDPFTGSQPWKVIPLEFMWPFLTLSKSFSPQAFMVQPKITLTCISWYRQRLPTFACFKMASIHNQLANWCGEERNTTPRFLLRCTWEISHANFKASVKGCFFMSLCSPGRGWMASKRFRAHVARSRRPLHTGPARKGVISSLTECGQCSHCVSVCSDKPNKSHSIAYGFIQHIWYSHRNKNVSCFRIPCTPAETDKDG